MNKTGIVIILLCFLAAAAVVLLERRKTRKTMEEIERMLDAAMTGSFSETNFDESQLSALETKFAHYLSAAEASSQNIAQEKDKIKTLIADISHQTKTPIANLLLYSELLMEETLPASAKANVEALYKQSEKLRFLIDSLVKLSRLENGIISLSPQQAALQPVRLIVVKSKEGLEKVGKAANIYQAPAAIVVCANKTKAWKRPFDGKITTDIDASILTDHMMLEATELGLGSVWICYFNPDILKEELNLPENLEPVNILALGYSDELDASAERHKDMRIGMDELVSYL